MYIYIYIYTYDYVYIYIYTPPRHQRKPNYRLILQEYLPGEAKGQIYMYRSLGVVSDKIASAKRNPVQTGNTTTTPPTTTTTTTTTTNNNDNKGR